MGTLGISRTYERSIRGRIGYEGFEKPSPELSKRLGPSIPLKNPCKNRLCNPRIVEPPLRSVGSISHFYGLRVLGASPKTRALNS